MSSFDARAKEWDTPAKTERAQAVAESIQKTVHFPQGTSAFEYGCGTGLLSFCLLESLGEVTLADSSTGMLGVLKEKIEAEKADNMTPLQIDLMADPRPEASYDVIYTLLTMHHIPETQRILEIFHSMLAENGTLCIADLDKEDGSFHGAGFDGHLGFEREDLREKAANAGFRDIRFQTCYTVKKEVNGAPGEFPVFLMTCGK